MLVWVTRALGSRIYWHSFKEAWIEFVSIWRNGDKCALYPRFMSYEKYESLQEFQGY